ncbi:MAG: hypothetical protein ACD_73C00308G0001 [uncultured bacterium]|nr:MAG: hypothetical protein ACD_73C00308G0001 [uncultured bacterium]
MTQQLIFELMSNIPNMVLKGFIVWVGLKIIGSQISFINIIKTAVMSTLPQSVLLTNFLISLTQTDSMKNQSWLVYLVTALPIILAICIMVFMLRHYLKEVPVWKLGVLSFLAHFTGMIMLGFIFSGM